jgi:hypothetical protein
MLHRASHMIEPKTARSGREKARLLPFRHKGRKVTDLELKGGNMTRYPRDFWRNYIVASRTRSATS